MRRTRWNGLTSFIESVAGFPQGLKPVSLLALGGTAEAMPFQNDL